MSPAFHTGPLFSPHKPHVPQSPAAWPSPQSPPSHQVIDTAYDSSGVRLATAEYDGSVSIWRPSEANEWDAYVHFPTRHAAGTIRAIRFAPDRLCPDLLATVGSDGLAVVYRLRTGRDGQVAVTETVLRDAAAALSALAFADNGLLATLGAERVLRIYESPDSGERWGLCAAVDVARDATDPAGVAFAPGAAFCVAAGDVVARGSVAWEWEVYARISDAEEGAGGNAVVCADWASSGFIGVGRKDGAVEVWQMSEGKLTRVASMGDNEGGERFAKAVKIEWDRAGGVLATAHEDRMLRTWARLPGKKTGEWRWCRRDEFAIADSS